MNETKRHILQLDAGATELLKSVATAAGPELGSIEYLPLDHTTLEQDCGDSCQEVLVQVRRPPAAHPTAARRRIAIPFALTHREQPVDPFFHTITWNMIGRLSCDVILTLWCRPRCWPAGTITPPGRTRRWTAVRGRGATGCAP